MARQDDPSTEILPAGGRVGAAKSSETAPKLIGRTLGKFTIIDRLGKGGSGEVFRAEQVQLGRTAVIKVLRHEVASAPNRVERFLREAKLASRLDHPYAAHIYQFGVEPDGVLWIAMEHVKGVTLDDLVARRGAMPASLFGPLFARLCEVVHTAHELAIVHRDIKGSNVMVIERAGQLLPKLLDFGIAKADDAAVAPSVEHPRAATHDTASDLTGHGVTLGSPHYMSPEQWERPADVDGRADIYALGVLAYRCVAGWLPFHTKDRHQLADAHVRLAPPALPEFVPSPLADAVMRALEKHPDARWQTAVAFGEAVSRAVGSSAPETVPIFDPGVRDAWLRAGPQPIADAVAHLTSATTTVEADAALRELVAITCRWLAVLALSNLPPSAATGADPRVREYARAVVGRDDGGPWLQLARAAAGAAPLVPGLAAALAGCDLLAQLASKLDDRDRARTAAALTANIAAAGEAMQPLEPLLAYHLVLGRADGVAESWQGVRRRERERVMVWGAPLAEGEVALLDAGGNVVLRLSPLAQVAAPLPSAEPELFLLWRSGRGAARLMAAPWGFERDDDAAGLRLASLSTEDSDTAADAGDDRSPYPGLAAYTGDDADRFVGREREVETIANRLVRAPLLAVLGPSGVGKSSFIAAGLLPRLAESHRILTMRPGRHPMHALAALPEVSGDSQDESSLAARLRELGESAQRGLVIVIDQLEEMVTLCADPDERRRFAETLAAAADGPTAPVRVIVTLRDDFATVIESEAAFRGRFEVFVLAAPAAEALRRIVIEPARRSAVSVDPKVVDDMVAEVAGRPASLPLLSFTASQLWQSRDKKERKITHEAYLALGGVAGALATYADQLYSSLARRDQDTVRDVFSRLVATDGTRIPAPRSELEQLPGARGVLAHLIDARLLVVRDDDGSDVIEIVHECLAERWPRLARWRSEDASDRALLADLGAAARRWHEAGRRADLLWRGEALAELRRLTARSTALTVLEREFADDAVRAQQRARRIRRGIVIGVMVALGAVAVVMAYLGIAANESRAQAERSAHKARESEKVAEAQLTANLIAQGKRELNDNRAVEALAYFGEAMKRGADSQGLREMVTIASRAWRDVLLVYRKQPSQFLVASPAGWFAVGSQDGTIRFWSDQGTLQKELATGTGSTIALVRNQDDSLIVLGRDSIALLDGKREITGHFKPQSTAWLARRGPAADEIGLVEEGAVRVYGLDGTLRRAVPIKENMDRANPQFSMDGRHAVFTADKTVNVVDLVTMQVRPIATDVLGPGAGAEDGSMFAYLDKEHHVQLFSPDGKLGKLLHTSVRPSSFVFSRTSDRIGVSNEHEVTTFDRDGKELYSFSIEAEQSMFVIDGDDAWTGGNEGVIRHYHDGVLVGSLPVTHTDVQYGNLARDGFGIVTSDQSLIIVRARAAQLVLDKEICTRVVIGSTGTAASYTCDDRVKVYVGRHFLGEYPASQSQVIADYDEATGRGVLSADAGIRVFDRDAKLVARSDKPGMALFDDADHIFVLEGDKALWRWTFATDKWDHIMPVTERHMLGSIRGTPLLGTADGKLLVISGGKIAHTIDLKEAPEFFVASGDGRWVVAQLASGAAAIIDRETWQVARTLAAGDAFGAAATFDATGDLVMRSSRNAMSIWDRATGEDLVFGFDLLRNLANARFLSDGRIETDGHEPGLLDLPRDMRPTSQIIHDIDCRVPLKVTGSRLEPSTTTCP